MEIRVCPECTKAFYTRRNSERLICLFCGFILLDRRADKRLRKDLPFTLEQEKKKLQATLRDYSSTGVRIVYKGRPLSVDAVLELRIDDLGIHSTARTVWTKRLEKSFYSSGFKFL